MDLESEQLFSECEDGLLLCKLINCAEYDTIDVRALNVPTKRKPLLVFHKVCGLLCCMSRYLIIESSTPSIYHPHAFFLNATG